MFPERGSEEFGFGLSVPGGRSGYWQRRRRMQLLAQFCGISFCTALLFTAIFLTRSVSDAKSPLKERQLETAADKVPVVTLALNLPKGTKLTEEVLQKVSWNRDSVPEGTLRSFEEVKGFYLLGDTTADIPLTKEMLSKTSLAFSIEDNLPQGFRAVAISVDATTSVESRTTPGSRVDVLLTYADPRDGQITTTVVCENAVVLSFGGEAKPIEDDSVRSHSDMQTSTVTLGASLQDTLRIQTATALGKINLVLRSKNDTESSRTTSITQKEIVKPQEQLPRKASKSESRSFVRSVDPDGNLREFKLTSKGWQQELSDPKL